MLEYWLRPTFQVYLVDPIAKLAHKAGLSANQVTGLGCLLGMATCPALALDYPLWALVLLWGSGFCDVLDGTLARLQPPSGLGGTVYDIVCDRVVELSFILGLYLQNPPQRATACMLMLGSIFICVTAFLVIGIVSEKQSEKSFYYSPGLIERAEAFLFFSGMVIWPAYFDVISICFTLLVCWTTLSHVRAFQAQA